MTTVMFWVLLAQIFTAVVACAGCKDPQSRLRMICTVAAWWAAIWLCLLFAVCVLLGLRHEESWSPLVALVALVINGTVVWVASRRIKWRKRDMEQ